MKMKMKGILGWKRARSSNLHPTSQPDTMLTGKLRLEWELPSRLKRQDIRKWISTSGAATWREGIVHLGRCDHQVAQFYGSVGARVLEGVISALESPLGLYKDTEYELTTSPSFIGCSYATMDPKFLSTLRLTLSWICLTTRNKIKNSIALSRGYWFGTTFHLSLPVVVDWSGSSWTKTLNQAIVACFDFGIIPKTPLLSTVFPIARQLAAVQAPIEVDGGLMYHGRLAALVPIERRSDGSIFWHIEMRWDLPVLRVSDIQCMERKQCWYQTLDLEFLQLAPALIR